MKHFFLFISLVLWVCYAIAQNSMGIGTDTPNPNAVVEMVSPGNNQGLLVPRLSTAQRTLLAFTATENGLLIYDSDENQFYVWIDPDWQPLSNPGAGDMLQSVYDTDANGIADSSQYALDAGTIAGLTVETAVPAGAVFTDSQVAADVGVTVSGNLTSTDVQAALEELQAKLDTTNSSPWAISGADLNYSVGNVGVGTVNPQANFQVGDQLGLFHFENAGFPVNGEVIADNLYAVNDSLYNIADGPTAFIFFDSGSIEFLHGDPLLAGQNALSMGQVSTSLRLEPSRHAEFAGAVEIGQVRDSLEISSGLMAFDLGAFWGFNGVDWIQFGGFSLPVNEIVSDGGSSPFYIQNDGGGGVARFEVNNTSAFGNPLEVQTNSNDLNSAGIVVNNDGLGSGIRVDLNNPSNTNNAITANTSGADGSAGYFYVNNASNPAAAVIGIIDAGAGNAVEGYTNGTGPAGRFTNANASNGSVAFVVQNDGTNSAATFSNSALASTAAVEILNNGTGAGLTIQNPGGTTSFGDISFINGDLGIGEFTPSAKLDVVGDTELNGNVTISGEVTTGNVMAADLTTSGAVVSSLTETANTNYSVAPTDHIIALTATTAATVTLPDASLNQGRELIIVTRASTTISHSIELQAGNNFAIEGQVQTTPITLSIISGEKVSITLRAIGADWYLVNSIVSNNI